MMDSITIGSVTADYLSRDQFREWLAGTLDGIHFRHVVTLNPEMVLEAETNSAFRDAVRAADLRVPDGAGIVWARWYLRSDFWSLFPSLLAFPFITVERITGVDTIDDIAELAAARQQHIYLLGGTPQQAQLTAKRLSKKHPYLSVTVGPDHKKQQEGPDEVLADIARAKPDILLVAYGAPEQTLWLETHRDRLSSVKLATGVGGAFALLSEKRSRAPRLLRRLNLEWLWRLILEPARLPRIWKAVIDFPRLIQQKKTQEN